MKFKYSRRKKIKLFLQSIIKKIRKYPWIIVILLSIFATFFYFLFSYTGNDIFLYLLPITITILFIILYRILKSTKFFDP
ncbi:hypothetical protein LCGC14_0779830 [marine sediment metagenome]|uniref:Uncharacterized protein n=1 Tax=marine sediment metagenome TaxID=412755 RepID=A0A0F9PW24_9ZZZZ